MEKRQGFHSTVNLENVSAPIKLKEYFNEFSSSFEETVGHVDKKRWRSVLWKKLLRITDDDVIKELQESCSIDKLDCENEPSVLDVSTIKKNPSLYFNQGVPEEGAECLKTLSIQKRRIERNEKIPLKYKNAVFWEKKQSVKRNLTPGKDILLTIRVAQPFKYEWSLKGNNLHPKGVDMVVVVGSQLLTELRDKIQCVSDLSIAGERSVCPDVADNSPSKQIYRSGFFYIGNTFYNDMRHVDSHDYSAVIRDWAEKRNIGPFKTASMEKTKFEDLEIRLGFPYVYQHQATCEHLLIFCDARLLHPTDALQVSSYPHHITLSTHRMRLCMCCHQFMSRWIAMESDRAPTDPCYYCETCFKKFNYKDDEKVGAFKAYEFFGNVVLI